MLTDVHPGELSDEDREYARHIAAAMGPWTDEQLTELARIVESAPVEQPDPRAS